MSPTQASKIVKNAPHPKVMTIDPGCWSTALPSSLNKLRPEQTHELLLEPLPTFPQSLFRWKNYDGAKALTAIFLLLSSIYLLAGFLGFVIDHTAWIHNLFYHSTNPPLSPQSLWGRIWHPVGLGLHHLASYVDIALRLFLFIFTYCLAWATFDPRNIEGYIMGGFNTLLGIVYLVTPVDMIPDMIPVVGTLDDTVFGFGILFLGLSSIYRNKFRSEKTKTILELFNDGNNQKALAMLLSDKGIALKKQ